MPCSAATAPANQTALLTFLGFLTPASGSAHVQGRDVRDNVSAARQAIAYLPEAATLYGHLNAYENLRYFLSLAKKDTHRQALDAALDRVALQAEAREMRMQTYSKGMRQKVAIAMAILREAPIMLSTSRPPASTRLRSTTSTGWSGTSPKTAEPFCW